MCNKKFNKQLATKILMSNGIEENSILIEEGQGDFAIEVTLNETETLPKIRNIFKAFKDIQILTQGEYNSEVELFAPYLTLYLDETR